MSATDVTLIAAVVLGWAFVSRRAAGSMVSAAMYFLAAGVLFGEVLGWFDLDGIDGAVRLLAEVTLAVVLFTDAANLDRGALEHEYGFPSRLLGIGLPLTILLGGVLAAVLLTDLTLAEGFVLAILLAPTDAALGQAVVSDERLPTRLRQGLNVESGLNDGICVPLLFAAIALAEAEAEPVRARGIARDMVVELAIAIAVGVAVALAIALVRNRAVAARWMDERWEQLVPIASVAAAYAVTLQAGGSGFIASFVAGLTYGAVVGPATGRTLGFAEDAGAILSAVTFVVFGVVLAGPVLADLHWTSVVYGLLSLTVVRMLPVAVALLGSHTRLPTVAFAGWFGPRGLASIVFMLVVVEESGLAGTSTIVEVATVTVILSVVLHGVSASPLTMRYAQWRQASHPHEELV